MGDGEALGGREHPAMTLGSVDPVRRGVKVVLCLLLVAAVVDPVLGLMSVAALPLHRALEPAHRIVLGHAGRDHDCTTSVDPNLPNLDRSAPRVL